VSDPYNDQQEQQERRDRELSELSGELRTVLPGATVLFAFLLTVPFSSGFPRLEVLDRLAFFVAFITAGAAVVLLLGEGAYHRLVGHPYDLRHLPGDGSGLFAHSRGRGQRRTARARRDHLVRTTAPPPRRPSGAQ